jgi:phosphoribosylformylglycinamidine (FGAM) synthase-like enzyme
VYADPYKGAQIAVSEAARNIVCSGGKPLGVTNCLNFGNPYDPEVYYQFVHAIKGMGEACRKFDTPVTGGNVSFYNQHPEGAVYPTPTIGMVGLLEDIQSFMTLDFKNEGDLIFLIGQSRNDIGSSEYVHKIKEIEFSPAPYFDLDEEFHLQEIIAKLISEKAVESVHDLSEGGLITALFEASFNRNLGFEVAQEQKAIRSDAYWFGESQSRVLVSVKPEKIDVFKKILKVFAFEQLGIVTSGVISVESENWGSVADWKTIYDEAIGSMMLKTS